MSSYVEDCLRYADLESNGLLETVNKRIEKNRKGSFAFTLTDGEGNPVPNAEVKVEQTGHAFKFGSTAFLANEFKGSDQDLYDKMFARLFNQAVLSFYWRDDEPERGQYRFDKGSPYRYRRPPADEGLDFCRRVGAEPKAHNMLWQNHEIGLPAWWPEDKAECMRLIRHRIEMLAERYADKIPVWDVTNECTNAIGIEKMPLGYDTAAWLDATRLFPDNHLILNDYYSYFSAYFGQMSPVYIQAQKLIAQGARIDGIGIQYHLFTKKDELAAINSKAGKINATHMLDMLDNFATLGRSLHISEITIPAYDCTPETLEVQTRLTENMYRLWFSHPAVDSIVWWNLADGYAYNGSLNEDYFGGGLLSHDLTPKPAYEALDRLINKEWHTSATLHTDAAGHACFEGFYGDYALTVGDTAVSATFGRETPPKTIKL